MRFGAIDAWIARRKNQVSTYMLYPMYTFYHSYLLAHYKCTNILWYNEDMGTWRGRLYSFMN